MTAPKGPVSQFAERHFRQFNAATLVDAARAYERQMARGGSMISDLYLFNEVHLRCVHPVYSKPWASEAEVANVAFEISEPHIGEQPTNNCSTQDDPSGIEIPRDDCNRCQQRYQP
jgi:hypothetical protein